MRDTDAEAEAESSRYEDEQENRQFRLNGKFICKFHLCDVSEEPPSQKIANDKHGRMETKHQLLERVHRLPPFEQFCQKKTEIMYK